MKKKCNSCKKRQDIKQFHKDRNFPDGKSPRCKTCCRSYSIKYEARRKRKAARRIYMKERFQRQIQEADLQFIVRRKLAASRCIAKKLGHSPCLITTKDLVLIFSPSCVVCGKHVGLSICLDHCHKTGAFRGWLCYRCNTALGMVDDSPERLEALSDYLRGK